MVNMHFSPQFCGLQTVQNYITLKMRLFENIIQHIYYALSRYLTKIVGDVGTVSKYSAPETLMFGTF